MTTFTVFTPTYNRKKTLHRVYESLCSQTFKDFEWLIVDDGSEDDTRSMVEEWVLDGIIDIRYFYQNNNGKHIAFNHGVDEAKGELFLTLDSDDACVPVALERFKAHWDAIPADKKKYFSAATSLCQNEYGKVVGDRFPQDVIDSDSMEIFYRYKVKGEKWGFHLTEVLRNFPFPDINGSRFVPEGIVWCAIAAQYKTRFFNEALRIYFQDDQLVDNQLSSIVDPEKYAEALSIWHQGILNNEIKYLYCAPLAFMKSAIHYIRFGFHNNMSIHQQFEKLLNFRAKLLYILMLPLATMVYVCDKWRKNNE